jgi:outer membrane receptor for ferrienterochelin and colicin
VTLNNGWSLKTGASFNYDDELMGFDSFSLNTYNRVSQFRFTAQKNVTNNLLLKTGVELNYQWYQQDYVRTDTAFQANMKFQSTIAAAFLEAEWKVSRKISARIGSRMEYAALLSETRIVPRFSMAYKTSSNSQISLAYGVFNQMPREDYMKFKPALSSEMAMHFIANYEYTLDKRLLRIEAFSKEYSKLVRYSALNDPNPLDYNNGGHGYARGVEMFLRDQKTLKYGDFWISYTYLDTKKLYQDLPSMQRPYLFSRHSVNLVGKYFVMAIKSQIGVTYQYSSGRPYYIPGPETTTMQYTSDFHNLSINCSYLARLFGYFTVIHFSASNILGFDQVYGYHFTKESETSGDYTAHPIKSPSKRFFVLGIFITLDKTNSQF